MYRDEVCAVVITYRPLDDVKNNLSRVRPQVGALVVVDNGSPETQLVSLRAASKELDFILLENGKNLGIAAALNRGVQWAITNAFQWIVLFDQDSAVTPGFIDTMLTGYFAAPSREQVGVICPTYLDKDTRQERPVFNLAADGQPLTCMTSGSMMPSSVFSKLGFFVEDLLIYCVDDEFCLRLRNNGYRIEQIKQAFLLHKEGASRFRSVFGLFRCYVTDQKPSRRYYITRNQLWVYSRYPKSFPALGPKWLNACRLAKIWIRTLLLEDMRFGKAQAIAGGALDFFRGRMGKTVEL